MPAKDLFHNTVRTALEKDGFAIADVARQLTQTIVLPNISWQT